MIRASALALAALLAAGAALAQELAQEADVAPQPSGAASSEASPGTADPAAEEAPLDPVAAWEAERLVILDAADVDLAAFEYVARPLVVFADSPRQPQFEEQMRLLEADRNALAERDVVVIVDSDPEARTAVRRELRPRGFGLVLVDKDGRVTLRRPAPVTVRDLARAIDRSPLRQEEIRYRGSGG